MWRGLLRHHIGIELVWWTQCQAQAIGQFLVWVPPLTRLECLTGAEGAGGAQLSGLGQLCPAQQRVTATLLDAPVSPQTLSALCFDALSYRAFWQSLASLSPAAYEFHLRLWQQRDGRAAGDAVRDGLGEGHVLDASVEGRERHRLLAADRADERLLDAPAAALGLGDV